MKSFLGMQVDQGDNKIKLHLDHYVQEMLTECKDYIKKSLRPKRVPMNPGVVLRPEDCPAIPMNPGVVLRPGLPGYPRSAQAEGLPLICG